LAARKRALLPQGEAAFQRALAAWRSSKDPQLADVLASFDAEGELAERLRAGTRAEVEALLEELAAAEPDPRIASALLSALTERATTTGETWRATWMTALNVLAAIGDPRAKHGRGEIVLRARVSGARGIDPSAVETLLSAIPDGVPAAVDPSELRQLIGARKATIDDLFATVYRDPEDHGARAVLADALLERGDPRGELIALQTAKKRSFRRERELVREHGAAWLGPLAAVVVPWTAVFEHGFLDACAIACTDPQLAEHALARPEWATVRALALHAPGRLSWDVGLAPLARAETLRSLVEITGIRPRALGEITAPVSWRKVGLNVFGGFVLSVLEEADRVLPNLEELDLGYFGGSAAPFAEALLALPLVSRSRSLTLEILSETVKVEWLAAASVARRTSLVIRRADPRMGWSWTLDRSVVRGHFAYHGQRWRPWQARVPPLLHAHAVARAMPGIELELSSDAPLARDEETLARELRAIGNARFTS
jgi:uncharacterized protein (TIGR02996 family)